MPIKDPEKRKAYQRIADAKRAKDPIRQQKSRIYNARTAARYATTPTHLLPTSRLPEYKVWLEMIRRCYNPDASSYKTYGAKGITVCDRWRASFADFLADMGRRPSKLHSIHRKKNGLPYEPTNCEWATDATQRRNRTVNVKVSYQGQVLTIAELAPILGIRRTTLYARARKWLAGELTLGDLIAPVDPIKSANAST